MPEVQSRLPLHLLQKTNLQPLLPALLGSPSNRPRGQPQRQAIPSVCAPTVKCRVDVRGGSKDAQLGSSCNHNSSCRCNGARDRCLSESCGAFRSYVTVEESACVKGRVVGHPRSGRFKLSCKLPAPNNGSSLQECRFGRNLHGLPHVP